MFQTPTIFNQDTEIRYSLADWFKSYDWQIYANLTFRNEVIPDVAWKSAINWLCKMREKEKALDFKSVIVMEPTKDRPVFHVHLVIGSNKHLRLQKHEDAWSNKHGIAKLYYCYKDLSPSFYMTKFIDQESNDINLRWDTFGRG